MWWSKRTKRASSGTISHYKKEKIRKVCLETVGFKKKKKLKLLGPPVTSRQVLSNPTRPRCQPQPTLASFLLQKVRMERQVALFVTQRLDAGLLLGQLVRRVPRAAVILGEVVQMAAPIVSVERRAVVRQRVGMKS